MSNQRHELYVGQSSQGGPTYYYTQNYGDQRGHYSSDYQAVTTNTRLPVYPIYYPVIESVDNFNVSPLPVQNFDHFTQQEIKYAECNDQKIDAMLAKDASDLANYVFWRAQQLHSQNHHSFIINLSNNQGQNPVFKQLDAAIQANSAQIPQGVSIQLGSQVSYGNVLSSLSAVVPVNPNAENVIAFSQLLTQFKQYARESNLVIHQSLTLEQQIQYLQTIAGEDKAGASVNTALIAWASCLERLRKEAGDDSEKLQKVTTYVQATQAILRDPNDTNAMENLLQILAHGAGLEELLVDVLHIAALFVVGIISGALTVAALCAFGPIGLVVFGALIAGFGIANFYGRPNDIRGRLPEVISAGLRQFGLFKSTELFEAGSAFKKSITQPDNDAGSDSPPTYEQHSNKVDADQVVNRLTPVYVSFNRN